jgi:hypothetical protein
MLSVPRSGVDKPYSLRAELGVYKWFAGLEWGQRNTMKYLFNNPHICSMPPKLPEISFLIFCGKIFCGILKICRYESKLMPLENLHNIVACRRVARQMSTKQATISTAIAIFPQQREKRTEETFSTRFLLRRYNQDPLAVAIRGLVGFSRWELLEAGSWGTRTGREPRGRGTSAVGSRYRATTVKTWLRTLVFVCDSDL